jgi:hemerythrin-like metal-binding protein
MKAFLERFILRKTAAQDVLPLVGSSSQTPATAIEKTIQHTCGVPKLDEQNEALFNVIRIFQGCLKSGTESDAMKAALASLGGHVENHLALEEAYLEHISFPGLAEHRSEHQSFRQQLQAIHNRITDGDTAAGLELSQLLFAWLRVHVGREDPVWSEFARARHRRFNPA